MPGRDGTGPLGIGPGTGLGRGPCVRGFFSRGRGFGRWRFYGTPAYAGYPIPAFLAEEEQIKILEAELKEIEAEKIEIEKTLKSLKQLKKE